MKNDEDNNFGTGDSIYQNNTSLDSKIDQSENRQWFDNGPFFSYSTIANRISLPSVLTDVNKTLYGSEPIDRHFEDIVHNVGDKIVFRNRQVRERFLVFSRKIAEINPVIFSISDVFSIFEHGNFKKVVSFRSMTDMYQRNKILISVLTFENERVLSPAVLQDLFGFTPSEGRLAALLINGKSVIECADELGVRISTVREKLSNLFAKTRTSRQPELVSMLSRLDLLV